MEVLSEDVLPPSGVVGEDAGGPRSRRVAFGQLPNNLETEIVSGPTPVRCLLAASQTGLNKMSLWTFMSCVHQVLIMAGSVPERLIKFIVWLHGTVMGV